MAGRNSSNKRKGITRSQKVFYVLSFLIIISMVLSLIASMVTL